MARDIWKYIPQKYWDAVEDVFVDSDGYWVYLMPGYRAYDLADECGAIHALTISELKQDLKTIKRIKKGV